MANIVGVGPIEKLARTRADTDEVAAVGVELDATGEGGAWPASKMSWLFSSYERRNRCDSDISVRSTQRESSAFGSAGAEVLFTATVAELAEDDGMSPTLEWSAASSSEMDTRVMAEPLPVAASKPEAVGGALEATCWLNPRTGQAASTARKSALEYLIRSSFLHCRKMSPESVWPPVPSASRAGIPAILSIFHRQSGNESPGPSPEWGTIPARLLPAATPGAARHRAPKRAQCIPLSGYVARLT